MAKKAKKADKTAKKAAKTAKKTAEKAEKAAKKTAKKAEKVAKRTARKEEKTTKKATRDKAKKAIKKEAPQEESKYNTPEGDKNAPVPETPSSDTEIIIDKTTAVGVKADTE
jgi:uncharacterized membrane protein YkoI